MVIVAPSHEQVLLITHAADFVRVNVLTFMQDFCFLDIHQTEIIV